MMMKMVLFPITNYMYVPTDVFKVHCTWCVPKAWACHIPRATPACTHTANGRELKVRNIYSIMTLLISLVFCLMFLHIKD